MNERNQTFLKTIMIASLLAGAVWIWYTSRHLNAGLISASAAPQKGFLAPDFKTMNLAGEEISLTNFRGQPVILNLWASWCLPCQKEMPALEQVYQDYHPDGLVLLALNATSQDNLEDVLSFSQELGLSFPILLDTTGDISKLYQLTALPTTYFISPEGKIVDIVVGGPISEALLRSRAESLLQDTSIEH